MIMLEEITHIALWKMYGYISEVLWCRYSSCHASSILDPSNFSNLSSRCDPSYSFQDTPEIQADHVI